MPARTVAGARALERVLGFEEFLRRVEGDRLERVVKTPEMFERFLPFAMAFGVERKWAKAFQDIYREPPSGTSGDHWSLRPGRLLQPAVGPVQPGRERHDLLTAQLGWIGVQRRVVRRGVGGGRWGRVLTSAPSRALSKRPGSASLDLEFRAGYGPGELLDENLWPLVARPPSLDEPGVEVHDPVFRYARPEPACSGSAKNSSKVVADSGVAGIPIIWNSSAQRRNSASTRVADDVPVGVTRIAQHGGLRRPRRPGVPPLSYHMTRANLRR